MMGSEACMFGMAGMGLIAILLIVALVLGIGALAKYLFFSKKREGKSAYWREGKEPHGHSSHEH